MCVVDFLECMKSTTLISAREKVNAEHSSPSAARSAPHYCDYKAYIYAISV